MMDNKHIIKIRCMFYMDELKGHPIEFFERYLNLLNFDGIENDDDGILVVFNGAHFRIDPLQADWFMSIIDQRTYKDDVINVF